MVQAPKGQPTPQQVQAMNNASFMRYTYDQPAMFNAQNGNAYTQGQSLNFDAPIIPGGFATKLRIWFNLTVNFGAGVTGTLNAGGLYNIFNNIAVTFGNQQHNLHPYLLKVLKQTAKKLGETTGQVLGSQASGIQSMVYSAPAMAQGNNTWLGYFEIPMNVLNPTSPLGLVPIGGSGTRLQVQITPPASFSGKDPLNNVVNATGGTPTVTGNVYPVLYFRDYKSMTMPKSFGLDLSGLPTVQIIKTPEINPLTAGTWNFKRISNPYPIAKLVSIVIDGQSSSQFAPANNITGYELDMAENQNNALFKHDSTTSPIAGLANYYTDTRERYQQDLDEGVLVIDRVSANQADVDLQMGDSYLNLTSGGYPAARLGYQVGTVGVTGTTGITPRVVSWAVIVNPDGIRVS